MATEQAFAGWRVAQILVDRGNAVPEGRGTGYLIRPGLVLTAGHVLAGALGATIVLDAGHTDEISIHVDPEKWILDARPLEGIQATQRGTDIAVISVPDNETENRTVPTALFGRLRGEDTAVASVTGCGFPLHKLRTGDSNLAAGMRVRDLDSLRASVPLVANRRTGTLALYVQDPPPEPAQESAPSPWEGFSGAALWSDGRIVGVAGEHHRSEGPGRLTGRRIDALYTDQPADEATLLRVALNLPDTAEELPSVPDQDTTHTTTVTRRIVGIRISAGVDLFRDRVRSRDDLRRLVLSREKTIVSVTGRRGIGKSGVVARVLAEFEEETTENTAAVGGLVYLSTRTGVGIVDVPRVFHALTRMLGGPAYERLERLWDSHDPQAIYELFEAVESLNVVLVLDNLDDLQDPATGQLKDVDLESFLDAACRVPRPPLIVTTSQKPLALPSELNHHVYRIEIAEGLELQDAIAYVREADAHGAAGLRDAPEDVVVHLVDKVHRLPRGLELLVSLRTDDPAFVLDEDPDATVEEAIEHLVTEGFESLDRVERDVVQHLALARAPLPVQALQGILDSPASPASAVKAAIKGLVRRRMISADVSGVRLHPLDSDFITRTLTDRPAELTTIDLGLADWLVTQRTDFHTWRTNTDVAPQRREFRHRLRAGDADGALSVLYDVAEFIAQHGEAGRVRDMLAEVPDTPRGPAAESRYRCICGVAEFYDGELGDSIMNFILARESARVAGARPLEAKAGLLHSIALRHSGRARESVGPLQDALSIGLERNGRHYALLQLSLAQCYAGDLEDAERTLHDFEEDLRSSDPALNWAMFHDAAALYELVSGNLDEVFTESEASIANYANSPNAPFMGYTVNVRGLAHYLRGDTETAVSDFKAAASGARSIGEARMEGLASLNLAWVYAISGEVGESRRYADRAAERLSKNGVAEARAAVQLRRALDTLDESALLEVLRDAVGKGLDNPDLYRPTVEDLHRIVQQLTG